MNQRNMSIINSTPVRVIAIVGCDGSGKSLSLIHICSLMSPLSHSMSIEEGQRLTDDCARMILSLPVANPDVPHAGRRALLFEMCIRDRDKEMVMDFFRENNSCSTLRFFMAGYRLEN